MKRLIAYDKQARGGWTSLLAALLLLASGSVPVVLAQTNPPSNRYLLVIDTGRSMHARAVAISNAMGNWFTRSMPNELRPGDTLGIWTFAAGLSTGRFPLQRWAPGQERPIIERVLTFIDNLTYDGEASLNTLHPALERLVKVSPFITVILVTDGAEPMRGTPFDKQINDIYKSWRERQQKAQMPFLTVLRARQGTITDFAVTPAPWTVEMPPLPPELQVVRTPAPQPEVVAKAPAAAAAPTIAPLIFHGTDPKPSAVEPATPAPGASQGATSPGAHAAAAPAAEVGRSASNPAAPAGTSEPARVDRASAGVLLARPEPLRYAVPGAGPGTASKPAPGTAAPTQAHTPSAQPGHPAASATASHPAAEAAPADSASVLPPSGWVAHKAFWLAALVVVTALVGLGLVLVRRTRPSPHVSLITRSFERENK